MLGCKLKNGRLRTGLMLELIDTCWDVNYKYNFMSADANNELIDTCWDVNKDEQTEKEQWLKN